MLTGRLAVPTCVLLHCISKSFDLIAMLLGSVLTLDARSFEFWELHDFMDDRRFSVIAAAADVSWKTSTSSLNQITLQDV